MDNWLKALIAGACVVVIGGGVFLAYGQWRQYAATRDREEALHAELRSSAGEMSEQEFCSKRVAFIEHMEEDRRAQIDKAVLDLNSRLYKICQQFRY